MVTIELRDNEDISKALKRLKRKCEAEGIMREMKKREFYRKPSAIRHEEQRDRKRKLAKLRAKEKSIDDKIDMKNY